MMSPQWTRRAALAPLVALTALLSVLAPFAAAQTVQVRSGEHATFSRLVLEIGAERSFALSAGQSRREITFDPPLVAVDLSAVFSLIPRDRLAEVTGVGGGLQLVLSCDCPVTVERFEGRFLVVDILDPEAAPQGPSVVTSEPDPETLAARRLAAAEALPDLTRLLNGGPPGPPRTPVAGAALVPSRPGWPVSAAGDMPQGPDDPGSTVSLDDAAIVMAEQLARAAAAGLLEAAERRPMSDADPTDRTGPTPLALALDSAMPPAPGLPLRAETAVDAALHRTDEAEPQSHRLHCDTGFAEVFDWAPTGPFGSEIGPLRRALFDDRDRLQADAAEALAQTYIFHGFGAEGAFWLAQMTHPPDHLRLMAALVDGVPGPHFAPLDGAAPCSEAELFWRYIDATAPSGLTTEQIGHIQRLTFALPDDLRDHLAPIIARRLAADGYGNAARNLRDMLVRGGRVHAATILHLDLDLGIPPDRPPAQTREALALALRDDGAAAPTAMAQALRFDRDIGVPAPPARLSAAAAILRETGPTPETMPLWREVVLALAATGRMDDALRYLGGPFPDQTTRDRTLTAVLSDRVAAGDIAGLVVLAHAFGASWGDTGSEAGRTRVAAMALLRAEGFAAAANLFRDGRRTLILPARPTPEPTPEDVLHQAWLSSDWDRIGGLADGAHRDLALRMAQHATQTRNQAPEIRLPELQATVDDSRILRETLRAVITAPSPRAAGGDG